MTNYITETFNGTNGATIAPSGATMFGTGTSVYTNVTPAEGSASARFNGGGNYRYASYPAAHPLIWVVFDIRINSLPGSNTGVIKTYNGATVISDLRITTAGALQLRDQGVAELTSGNLTVGQWHRIAMRIQPGEALGHRLKLYPSPSSPTATYDQPAQATRAGQTSLTGFDIGIITSVAGEWDIDNLRVADVEEGVSSANPIATSTVTRQAKVDATGSTSPVLTQASGPTVTINSGASPVFLVDLPDPANYTADVVLTLTGSDGGEDATQTITLPPPGASSSRLVYDGTTWR